MNRRNFFAMMIGNLAWVFLPGCGNKSESNAVSGTAAAPHFKSDEVRAYEEENRKQLEAAIQREKEGQRLAEAMAHTRDYREQLQSAYGDAWGRYVSQHMKTLMVLRKQADQSLSKTAPCTICDGRGNAGFCIPCNNTGKCPTCNGSGSLPGDAMCPTCQGRNSCFLCHGSGKMACAFCDDGSVYVQQPNPPDKIPIG